MIISLLLAAQLAQSTAAPSQERMSEIYKVALKDITFKVSSVTGCYHRAYRQGVELEYPSSEVVGTSLLNLSFVEPVATSPFDTVVITVIDPDGRFMFRVSQVFQVEVDLVIVNPKPGQYILHASSKKHGSLLRAFQCSKPGMQVDLGPLVLAALDP